MTLEINNFSSGWQNKAQQEKMKGDALYKCQDISLDEVGAIRCANLHKEQAYFATQTIASPIGNVFFLDVEGSSKYLIYYTVGTNLYCWNSVTGVTRAISTAMTLGAHVSYAVQKPVLSEYTYVFVTDGKTMLCDNGTTTRTWGIDPPDAAPAISTVTGTGNLSAGDYRYVYTFYDQQTGIESEPSPMCAALTANANDLMIVTGIRTSNNPRVTARALYRTVANGGTFYLVGIISDNVTTEFDDSIADSSLNIGAVMNAGIPPTVSVALSFKEVMLLAGNTSYPNRVYYSLATKPDSFPSTYYLDVGSADLRIKNMVSFAGTVYLVHESGIEQLTGESADTFDTTGTRAHVGTNAPWSVAVGPDGIYRLVEDGVYRFDGVKDTRMSDPIGRSFENTPDEWNEVVDQATVGTVARGCFLRGVYYVLVPLKDVNGTVVNKIMSYDTVGQTWLLHNLQCTHLWADEGRGKLYGGLAGGLGGYTVFELFTEASSASTTATPDAVTKSYRITRATEYALQDAGTMEARTSQPISWLRGFRVDAQGSWMLYFYLDDRLVHTEVLTGLTGVELTKWYNFASKLKGLNVYVRILGIGTCQPDTHVFRGVEIR